jgi:hypothetical protein
MQLHEKQGTIDRRHEKEEIDYLVEEDVGFQ